METTTIKKEFNRGMAWVIYTDPTLVFPKIGCFNLISSNAFGRTKVVLVYSKDHPDKGRHWRISTPQIFRQKRIPDGDPIPNYFPPAIDSDLFYQVQEQIRRNHDINGHAGGQTGKCNNLFVHILKCGLCKSPVHFIDKGTPPKGGKYLHCDHSRRKLDCNAKPIRYDEFEKLIFDNLEELNPQDLLQNNDEIQIELNDLNRRITANTERIQQYQDEEENLLDSIATTKSAQIRERLESKLIKTITDKKFFQNENNNLQKEKKNLEIIAQDMQSNIGTTKEVYALLQSATEDEKINIRSRLRTEIRKLISQIEIYPLMQDYKPIEEIEPGIYQTMNSKHIDKVRIKFNGSKKMRLLYLKTHAEQV